MHLPFNEKKILQCMGHISPIGVVKMFGITPEYLRMLCYKHKIAFDVNQVRLYGPKYREILEKYLIESNETQGIPVGVKVNIEELQKECNLPYILIEEKCRITQSKRLLKAV